MENKETLEEVMNKDGYHESDYDKIWREGVQLGAKWQAERMYSEEEVLNIIVDCDGSLTQAKKWFEQFKKK
jgi:ATP-dependent protease HslVU (ClpYQ) peptidase subunit